jgi:ketosteroid isomerase-like protein
MPALASLDSQEVEQYARAFEDLFYQGDYRTMAAYYTEDAQLMAEERETFQGREVIEQFWQAVCQLKATMTRTIEIQEIVTSGDLGYTRSKVTTRMQGSGEQMVTMIFKDIAIWKRGPDGMWRIAVDISNHDPVQHDQTA